MVQAPDTDSSSEAPRGREDEIMTPRWTLTAFGAIAMVAAGGFGRTLYRAINMHSSQSLEFALSFGTAIGDAAFFLSIWLLTSG
jgi:hypothetical protein